MRAIAVFIVSLIIGLPPCAGAQTLLATKHIEFRFENYLLRGALLGNQQKASSRFLRDYYAKVGQSGAAGAYLSTYTARMYGLEVHKMSAAELALEGAGTAATIGLFAGAVANTLGIWDEDTTWLLVGAMSALGAAHGAYKADDPGFNLRIRWKTDER